MSECTPIYQSTQSTHRNRVGLARSGDAQRSSGPTEKQVNDVREAFMRDFETSMKQNSYLVSQISLRYQYGEDVKTLFSMPDYYRQLNAAAIQEAARTYLKMDRFVRVTLLPEAAPEKK